jgi:transposase
VVLATTPASPDPGGLRDLVARVAVFGGPVRGAIESMTGARFVRDALVEAGWEVEVADAQRVKGLAPLACKTDRIDAWVLAELSRRDLVPAIWLPPPAVRADREQARFRLHLVKHRVMLKGRIHSTLMTFGVQATTSDLFGIAGRDQLARLGLPEPWAGDVAASLALIDILDEHIDGCEAALRAAGVSHPYLPRLMSVPGIGWVLGYTIGAEIGDITRFPSPAKLVGYTGLCPRVYQSGHRDRRGPVSKAGPKFLRWALIEATTHACAHPAYRDRYARTKKRLGPQRGSAVARVELARDLAHAIWHMLTKDQDFAPAGATGDLAA